MATTSVRFNVAKGDERLQAIARKDNHYRQFWRRYAPVGYARFLAVSWLKPG
jgi:hypothetical protein